MKFTGLNEIREMYLSFFESKQHLRLPSFSLVPQNDPSILLINAGMTPLKPYFTGATAPPAPRVTTCQKCIRTPDIERVGITSRHGTFFEMLGNFSFGDYFKEEIIPWSWEFCTQVLAMPEDRLYVSVYESDDEAYEIWQNKVGLPEDRIVRMGKEDNFWEHGTGPCGPCSELYFDRGVKYGCGSPDCKVGCECDRFVEFWNLVFTQYNKEADGSYTPLEKKNIDTGAGLERVACIMQDVASLFEVDTIRSVLDKVCQLANKSYGQDERADIAIRVVTDHIRSTTMMISDGIIPSNEGRGYVLRRLLRRAARYGKLLGIDNLFLEEVAEIVIRESAAAYPELTQRQDYILKIIRIEEERFSQTIQQGLTMLEELLTDAKKETPASLKGEDVFRLHDTYGFPLDLTREIALEQGVDVDESGFQHEMNLQKEKARSALRDKGGSAWSQGGLPEAVDKSQTTAFTGYERLEDEALVRYLLSNHEQTALLDEAGKGDVVQLITDKTPFYGESGGQTGDQGELIFANGSGLITDTKKSAEGLFLHQLEINSGTLRPGMVVTLKVNSRQRLATARNHTTTHILHQALKQVLGNHVAQSGSSVTPERLRFDFSHFQPLSDSEKQQVETIVNDVILSNRLVHTQVMPVEEARKEGAVALFDEKYGDTVRVVSVGDYSRELCGGTHLSRSSEACLFKIVSESGIAAGVRRIEAVTGEEAIQLVNSQQQLLQQAAQLLKTAVEDMPRRIEAVLDQNKALEKQVQAAYKKQAGSAADDLVTQADQIDSIKIIAARVDAKDQQQLRDIADQIKQKAAPAVVILASADEQKVMWVVMAAKEALTKGVHAGQLIREAAKITGGGGGGRPDMAQAGGKDASKIEEALTFAINQTKNILEQGK